MNKVKNANFVQHNSVIVKTVIKTHALIAKMDLVSMNKRRNVTVLMTEISMRQQEHAKKRQD